MTDTVRVPRAWLEAFRRDTDPTEPIADNGGTVWDMFCHEAAAMLAASPQGEGSSAEAPMEAVAWRYRQTSQPEAWAVSLEDMSDWSNLTVQPLYTHPVPIKPSADTGELRERVAQIIEAAIERHNPGNSLRHTMSDADAILGLIQSERGSSPIGQNDQPGLAVSDAGEP